MSWIFEVPTQALHHVPDHGSCLASWFPLHGSVDLLGSISFNVGGGNRMKAISTSLQSNSLLCRDSWASVWVGNKHTDGGEWAAARVQEISSGPTWSLLGKFTKFSSPYCTSQWASPLMFMSIFKVGLHIFSVIVLLQSISSFGDLKALMFSLLQQQEHNPVLKAEPNSLFLASGSV